MKTGEIIQLVATIITLGTLIAGIFTSIAAIKSNKKINKLTWEENEKNHQKSLVQLIDFNEKQKIEKFQNSINLLSKEISKLNLSIIDNYFDFTFTFKLIKSQEEQNYFINSVLGQINLKFSGFYFKIKRMYYLTNEKFSLIAARIDYENNTLVKQNSLWKNQKMLFRCLRCNLEFDLDEELFKKFEMVNSKLLFLKDLITSLLKEIKNNNIDLYNEKLTSFDEETIKWLNLLQEYCEDVSFKLFFNEKTNLLDNYLLTKHNSCSNVYNNINCNE